MSHDHDNQVRASKPLVSIDPVPYTIYPVGVAGVGFLINYISKKNHFPHTWLLGLGALSGVTALLDYNRITRKTNQVRIR